MVTRVLACVLRRGESLLVCQRPDHKRHGGLWEFPGGKVEPGEDNLAAARREMAEELDIEVTAVGQVVFKVADPGSDFLIEFLDVATLGEPRRIEHTQLAWTTAEELPNFDLAPSDRRFAEWLLLQATGAKGASGFSKHHGEGR